MPSRARTPVLHVLYNFDAVRFLVYFGVSIVMAALFSQAEPTSSLRPTNYVNDFSGVLDATTSARLNDLCRQVDQKAKAQIAVVTVKSITTRIC